MIDLHPKSNTLEPVYHTGPTLEQHFYQYWLDHKDDFNTRRFIPIFWTDFYMSPNPQWSELQEYLDSLNPSDGYFAVSREARAIFQRCPPNTLQFTAGGKRRRDVAIPLICSPIPNTLIPESSQKRFLASFVGSHNSHPCRRRLRELYQNDRDFYFCSQRESKYGPATTQEELQEFIKISTESEFMLCPRGYGPTSFRLYEAFQLGAVPVYITGWGKEPWLPWEDEIDWSEICVVIHETELNGLGDTLRSIPTYKIEQMKAVAQDLFPYYFSMNGVCKNIQRRLHFLPKT